MRGFTHLRKGECPICSGDRSDCRQSHSTGLIHCRHGDANPAEFSFVGEDALGFGMWANRLEREQLSEQHREEWRRQQELERQQRLAAEAARNAQALTEAERDHEIRQVLTQLALSPQHRADLHRRGLNEAQIKAGMFRSVEQWQKLDFAVSHHLAGVSLSGRSLIAPQPGYICPLWSAEGLLIGWQVRRDDKADGGKYRWASSATKKRPNGPTSHLRNGELPLTVCRPNGKAKRIALIEGVLKPYIAAQLSGEVAFIGAAGGNFTASFEQLKAILARLSAEVDTPLVTFYPDAGGVSNPQVYRRDCETIKLVQSWGYTVEVADWGQLDDKSQPDWDELPANRQIAFIPATTYLKLAQPQQPQRGDSCHPIEPDSQLYQQYRDWEDEREQIEQAQAFESFLDWLQAKTQKAAKSFKGFGQPPRKPVTLPRAINFNPNVPLPTPDDYQDQQPPLIRFQPGQRLQVMTRLIAAGWHHLLDTSAPGFGKSHDAGLMAPHPDQSGKIWYLSRDHRNPTTLTIEQNYTDLPVRHSGLHEDSHRTTPSGQPHLKWATVADNETPDIPPLCWQGNLFIQLKQKGYQANARSGELNPICQKCPFSFKCGREIGDGYGFRHARKVAMESNRIRSSPDSVPHPEDYNLTGDGAFWDEAMSLLRPVNQVTADLRDFDQVMAALEEKAPDLFEALRPLRITLRPLLTGEMKQPYHGWNDQALRGILGQMPENLAALTNELESLLPEVADLVEEPDSVRGIGGEWYHLGNFVRSEFKRQAYRQTRDNLTQLASNWLLPFLRIWAGLEPGALRLSHRHLTITTREKRHLELARHFRWNVYQDATADPQYLALYLGIHSNDIIQLEQECPSPDNLTAIQVEGFGLAGKARSHACEQRIAAIKEVLKGRHGEDNLALLDWKLKDYRDGWWFNHSRGTNEWQQKQALASFGIPYPNIGLLEDIWLALTSKPPDNHSGFTAYVDWQTRSEIAQAVGRLRAHLRPEQPLTYYFCADYDLSFLQQQGIKVMVKQAFEITPEAGTHKQFAQWKLLHFAQQLLRSGKKLTQASLSKASGISQGYISKLTQSLNGRWQGFKQLFQSLYSQPVETGIFFEGLQNQELRAWLELEPIEVIQECVAIIVNHGWKTFAAVIAESPPDVQMGILGMLGALLPGLTEELTAIFASPEIGGSG